ncbi:MAG: NUDIX domain-containing protein [Patescibacteria group bacterium]|nr:NUDIX domain-containing protein [Patescibacteria group bacterium]
MNKIIIASGPVIVENGKVLLNKHGDTPFWKFCGGKVETFDITLKEAAVREAKEEVGIDLDFVDAEPFVMHTVKKTADGDIDVLLVHFLANRVGEVKPGVDIREVEWLDVNNLPDDLAPNIIPTLKHFGYLS